MTAEIRFTLSVNQIFTEGVLSKRQKYLKHLLIQTISSTNTTVLALAYYDATLRTFTVVVGSNVDGVQHTASYLFTNRLHMRSASTLLGPHQYDVI